jgi:deazaflavin-dependent oxidoreductase (nitroreductase family)
MELEPSAARLRSAPIGRVAGLAADEAAASDGDCHAGTFVLEYSGGLICVLIDLRVEGDCMSAMDTFKNDPIAFNARLVEEYRANGGKLKSLPAGARLMLLTTTGARTGQERITPLGFATEGDRWLVIASANGSPKAPDWYYNLVANPAVVVELGNERVPARATVAEGAERTRLWEHLKTRMPFIDDHEQRAGRQIPIVILERAG